VGSAGARRSGRGTFAGGRQLNARSVRQPKLDRRIKQSRALLFASVLAVCIGCDQATKLAATGYLEPASTVSLAADTVRFELAHNPGAFMSLGAELPGALRRFLFLGLVPLGLLLASGITLRFASSRTASLVALGLIAGGGVSNWLDRLAHNGSVTDFLSVGIGPVRTAIFNVADLAVVSGVLLLAIAPHYLRKRPQSAA